ncbi:MAG: hypothetical protein J6V76_01090 [Bacteroidales bacterium]|nr:hypothetical protein [Bacteroidales bacterium]
MKYKKILTLALAFSAATAIMSCGGTSGGEQQQQQNGNDGKLEYNPEAEAKIDYAKYGLDSAFIKKYQDVAIGDVGEMIQSFPSPVEVSAIIQDMKVQYTPKYLFSTDYADNFETSFKKALGLGVYCADLGYLNVYNKTGDVIQYLVAIRKLSEQLQIGQFFDFAALKQIATSSNNLDSLLITSVQSYFQMDSYLRQNGRSNISALMVTGVWTESLYLASEVYAAKPNKRMKEHIASQKNILDDLMAILVKFMNNDPSYIKMVAGLKQLTVAFEPVKIQDFDGEDKTEVIDGQRVTTQGAYTTITVSDEQIDDIVKAVEKFRNDIVTNL